MLCLWRVSIYCLPSDTMWRSFQTTHENHFSISNSQNPLLIRYQLSYVQNALDMKRLIFQKHEQVQTQTGNRQTIFFLLFEFYEFQTAFSHTRYWSFTILFFGSKGRKMDAYHKIKLNCHRSFSFFSLYFCYLHGTGEVLSHFPIAMAIPFHPRGEPSGPSLASYTSTCLLRRQVFVFLCVGVHWCGVSGW